MKIETQIAIRDALAAGGDMKAVAKEHGVPFANVRKAALEGWPDIPTLPHTEDGGVQVAGRPVSNAPPSTSPTAAPTTMEKLEAIQAQFNPKLLIRDTARIVHLHLLRATVKGEMKMMEAVAAGKLLKDLLYIQQNTGAAKEDDLETIARLQQVAESGDPQGIIDFYIDLVTANQGVTNPDILAPADPEPEAKA